MKPIVIRYATKPEGTQQNTQLVEDVFRALDVERPPGVRYLVLRLEDGSFVHIVAYEGDAEGLTTLPAFGKFQEAGPALRAGTPERHDAEIVGNYRMLAH
jgi:hypothetical protein